MYKALNNIDEIEAFFEELGVAVFPNSGGSVVEKISLKNFFRLDYRVSNPRLLSLDDETKVTGGPFSQNKFANYIFGVAIVGDVVPEDPFSLISKSDMDNVYNSIRNKVALSLSHSNKEKVSGDMAVFVGSPESVTNYLDVSDSFPKNTLVLPFFLSTSVFYNPYRVTVGAMNNDEEKQNILDSLIPNFTRQFGNNDCVISLLALNPEETKEMQDCFDSIEDLVEQALEKYNENQF